MNKQDRKAILDYRMNAKHAGVNRYRFAWEMMKHQPNLVVEIIREWLKFNEIKP